MRMCELCGNPADHPHHVFFGKGRRALSEKYGLVADLCHYCHTNSNQSVHKCKETRDILHKRYQRIFEETHTREEFMSIFGRNYL